MLHRSALLPLALSLVAGCHLSPPVSKLPSATESARSMKAAEVSAPATVSIRLPGLRGWHRGTRHLTSFDGSAITRVRLTALGPGITPALVTTTSFTTDAGDLPAI